MSLARNKPSGTASMPYSTKHVDPERRACETALCPIRFLVWARDETSALGDNLARGHVVAAVGRLRLRYQVSDDEALLPPDSSAA